MQPREAMQPGMQIRELRSNEVTFTLEIEDEDIPVRGNAIVSGDDEYDRQIENELIQRLENGDLWAWCFVRVRATWGEFSGEDCLGGCSYRDEADFKRDGYFDDMKERALEELNARVRASFDAVSTLIG